MNKLSYLTWINGQQAETISAFDRGLSFGDGLFETMLFHQSATTLLPYHLQRLRRGLRALDIALDFKQLECQLGQYCQALVDLNVTSAVVKVLVTRGAGGRGYGYDRSLKPTVMFSSFPFSKLNQTLYKEGISLSVSYNSTLPNQYGLAGIKHLNRLHQVKAKGVLQQSNRNCFDTLLLNAGQRVIETVSANLFWVEAGILHTPKLFGAGVEGTRRQWLLDQANSLGITSVQESPCLLSNLKNADEVFICNSVFGFLPVKAIEVWRYSVGPVARKIMEHWQPVYG